MSKSGHHSWTVQDNRKRERECQSGGLGKDGAGARHFPTPFLGGLGSMLGGSWDMYKEQCASASFIGTPS